MRPRLRPILIILACTASLLLLVWSIGQSGVLALFRNGTDDDPARLAGRTLELAGADARDPAARIDLAGLRGKPVLVCRMNPRGGLWLCDALARWRKGAGADAVVLAAFTAGDEVPPATILAGNPYMLGVVIDGDAVARWGFTSSFAELRLVDRDGRVRTVNLASDNDRDATIVRLDEAWKGL